MHRLVPVGLALALLLPIPGRFEAWDDGAGGSVEGTAPGRDHADGGQSSAAASRVGAAPAVRIAATARLDLAVLVTPAVRRLELERDRRDEVRRSRPGGDVPRLVDAVPDH